MTQGRNALASKVLRNVLSRLGGTAVGIVVNLLLMPFVIGQIGASHFGIWALVNSLVGYMGLLDIGLSQTLTKKSAESLAKDDWAGLNETLSAVFSIYLVIGVFVGCTVAVASPIVPHLFHVLPSDRATFQLVLLIVGFQTALSFPMSSWGGLIGGLQDFHVLNLFSVILGIGRAISTYFVLSWGGGLVGLVVLNLVLTATGWLANFLWVRHRIPALSLAVGRVSSAKLKELASFGVVMLLWGIAGQTNLELDRVIVGAFLPVAAVTVYEVGLRLNNYSRTVVYAAFIILPTASELKALENRQTLQSLYITGTKYLVTVYTAVVVALLLFGREFINLWMGQGYEESVLIMYILLLGSLYQAQNAIAHVMLPGMGELRVFTRVMIAYPIIKVILSILLVSVWGMLGVALASTITYIVLESYFMTHILRLFEVRMRELLIQVHVPILVGLVPSFSTAVLLHLAMDIDSWLKLSFCVSAFLCVYFATFLFVGMTGEHRRHLKSLLVGPLSGWNGWS